jgi:outer membrane protein OmpA-like peptidoglycan-associated protein
MIKSGQGPSWTIALISAFVLATSGCATKKYVNSQVEPVNQRLSQYEKQTNDRLAWLNNKQAADMAQVHDRLAATDQRLNQVAQVANSAQASIVKMNEENSASRSTEEMEITNAANSAVSNALNYRLVEKANVTFGFNKANLTPSARSTLDAIVAKFQASPRAVVELAGFTDPIGSSNYNLGLSRRRAWAVERYLVEHNVPIRSIHVVGLGEEAGPPSLGPASSTGGKTDYRDERRVNIRVFGAGDIAGASGT